MNNFKFYVRQYVNHTTSNREGNQISETLKTSSPYSLLHSSMLHSAASVYSQICAPRNTFLSMPTSKHQYEPLYSLKWTFRPYVKNTITFLRTSLKCVDCPAIGSCVQAIWEVFLWFFLHITLAVWVWLSPWQLIAWKHSSPKMICYYTCQVWR